MDLLAVRTIPFWHGNGMDSPQLAESMLPRDGTDTGWTDNKTDRQRDE